MASGGQGNGAGGSAAAAASKARIAASTPSERHAGGGGRDAAGGMGVVSHNVGAGMASATRNGTMGVDMAAAARLRCAM
jgi:hypothetical protein